MNLNSAQKEAIEYTQGPCLIIAGAGSGKTRVITHKILHLIEKKGLSPKQIVAVTFTNKAAREMQSRIRTLAPKARGLRISTFHTLGLSILKKESNHIDLSPQFSLFDDQDSLQLLKSLAEGPLTASSDTLKGIQNQISLWKNQGISPQLARELATQPQILDALLFEAYERALKAFHAVDFDDLLLKPATILKNFPDIREKWQNGIRYFLVDEYQDTNEAQYQLLRLLVGPQGHFTAVGDDDQSIYTWRGARPENFQLLQKDYPNLKVTQLTQNYRSTQTILNAANGLIAKNEHLFNKQLWSNKGLGEDIRVLQANDSLDEAELVIGDLMYHHFQHQNPYHDYAILYRSNHQSRVLETTLRKNGIPYQVSGGTSFFAKTEVKDILAYFRLLLNPDDDNAFLRIVNTPRREIGASTLEKLSQYAKNRNISLFDACFEMGLSQYLEETPRQRLKRFAEWITNTTDNLQRSCPKATIEGFVEESGYWFFMQETANNPKQAESKQDNVRELLNWLYELLEGRDDEPGLSFSDAIQRMILLDILDNDSKETPNRLCLSTLHAAKGLEFPIVYVVGVEEDILPHKNSIEMDNIAEERRLMYVGITRAMEKLTLSYALQRQIQGNTQTLSPSRFLEEIPAETLHWPSHPKAKQSPLINTTTRFASLRSMLGEE